MKRICQIEEGPEALARFQKALKTVLSVPKAAIAKPAKTKRSRQKG